MMNSTDSFDSDTEIAIIGMAFRFPGARNAAEFWNNLQQGIESISFFNDRDLELAGIQPRLLSDPRFVKSGFIVEDEALFDAAFFGMNPKEAEILDPQQRFFLECAWEALEDAGYDPETYTKSIGVYAGTFISTYLQSLLANEQLIESVGPFILRLGNDKDYLATRTSYKLNLRGPSVTVQTSCSTSLVALHLACQSLLGRECDMALAGGVSISLPQKSGYLYQDGGLLSPDGHCRAFDASANGTVFGNGVGLVVLKRLSEALAAGDRIHAIVKGSAINNDGSLKVGYTAPSVSGQANVIAEALAVAQVEPDTIGYIEAHGTGTPLGDPIEIAALTKVFQASTSRKHFCPIGTVKSNVGHLGAAAGMAGLIKTILALQHQAIPPSLHWKQPNPKIDFENSPFYINMALTKWERGATPRRAGVSAFGFGGTNAHVVLEEAPPVEPSDPAHAWHLLTLSAKTRTALDRLAANLMEHFKQHPDLNLGDVAYSLQVRRAAWRHRQILVCQDLAGACSVLEKREAEVELIEAEVEDSQNRMVTFMFTGQGAQYVNMMAELYQSHPIFRTQVDQCCERLQPWLGLDLRSVLYPTEEQREAARQLLDQTWLTQPALFVVEYALAKLWMAWGVEPQALIGHSLGEYTAACLAGVFSLNDALALVAARGRLMWQLPSGTMISVPLPEPAVQARLESPLSIAAINGPASCVVSGPTPAMEEWVHHLAEQGISFQRVHTSHAFHSDMMDSICEPFTELVRQVKLAPPRVPYISNVTGTWITAEQATDPSYWANHLRQPVRFAEGVHMLLQDPGRILLEIGPGRTLCSLAELQPQRAAKHSILSSVRHPHNPRSDLAVLLEAAGRLWLAGVKINWATLYKGDRRQHVSLPTYPFERQHYWIESRGRSSAQSTLRENMGITDWFYIPAWQRTMPPLPTPGPAKNWLVFSAGDSLSQKLVQQIEAQGQQVITVSAGEQFMAYDANTYLLDPVQPADYEALLETITWQRPSPIAILHLWNVSLRAERVEEAIYDELQPSFYSLLFLAQAIGKQTSAQRWQLAVISNDLHQLASQGTVRPDKAALLGPCRVIPQEMSNVVCSSIDVVPAERGSRQEVWLVAQIIAELNLDTHDTVIAYRGRERWVQTFEPAPLAEVKGPTARLRPQGVYLITDGWGERGLALAGYLAQTVQARLVLTSPARFPAPDQWADWLVTHPAQDNTSTRIRAIQALEAVGAQVRVAQLDLLDREQVKALVDFTYEQFGALHGVIHATRLLDEGLIQSLTEQNAANVLNLTVQMVRVLETALRSVPLDFWVLCSSITALTGGRGQIAVCAANAFLDAFAVAHSDRAEMQVMSISWSDTLSPAECAEAFQRILARNCLSHIAVCAQHLPTLIQSAQVLPSTAGVKPVAPSETPDARHKRPNLATDYLAPHGDLEERLVTLWEQVLGVSGLGVQDNFFELGGHSVVAMQLVSRIRDALSIELPVRQLFETPIISGLAKFISHEQLGPAGEPTVLAPLTSATNHSTWPTMCTSGEEGLPLSFAQQRLWFLSQLEPENAFYNLSTVVRLTGPLNVQVLQASFEEVARRHHVLRTNFIVVNDQPTQRVAADWTCPLPVIDLQALPALEGAEYLRQLVSAEVRRPFNLEQGLLIRTTLLRLSQDEHLLLIIMHHIASDAWSRGILLRELAVLYPRLSAGRDDERVSLTSTPMLPALPIQYADFTVWQRDWLRDQVLETQLNYWKNQLSGAPTICELPSDHPRPPLQTFQGAQQSFMLHAALRDELLALSQQSGATLFMTLLAAFTTLVYRYTRQDDVLIGTPVSNRNRSELENLIGLFLNTLVIRTKLGDNPSFLNLLKRVRQSTLDAYAHQDLPFERLVDELQPERDLSRTPLFQLMFILQTAPLPALELSGLALSLVELDPGTAKFDVTLSMLDTPQGLTGVWEYNTALFDAATITRLTGHFQTLLEGIVADPQQRVSALSWLTRAERHQLLMEWNDTRTPALPEGCIHEWIEAQAVQRPDAVVLVCEGQHLTYRELERRANQLARYLQRLNVRPGDRVGVYLERSLEMLITLLGILKAGAAYVPLDRVYPEERVAFIIAETQLCVLLVHQTLLAGLPASQAHLVCLDTDWDAITQECSEPLIRTSDQADLAYVIYTSGSTGRPKGVQIPHGALSNFMHAMRQRLMITAEDVLLAVTTLSFDIAGLEFFLPAIVGARIMLASYEETLDGHKLSEGLSEARVTIMQATPATWRLLLEAGWSGSPSLKILCGGEALPESLALALQVRGTELWNLYGPTETTIWSAACLVKSPRGWVPIGRPLANTDLYLLDADLNPVPIGVPGELYLAGAGLAWGYYARPDVTAERFIPNPLRGELGVRLYRTGDWARYHADGQIEFLGRTDHQVKVRGFRIELGEIETALRRHPAVRDCVVQVQDRSSEVGDKWLVAFIVPEGESTPAAYELRTFLKDSLPEYMLPSVFATLTALPLTANGKVDRRALPSVRLTLTESTGEFVAPRSTAEQQLAEIWRQVLSLEQVGIYDNFFECGGDSIRTIQVVARARALGLALTPRQLFQHQTIAELAGMLEPDPTGETDLTSVTPVEAQGWPGEPQWLNALPSTDRAAIAQLIASDQTIEDLYPLAPLQHGMLFHTLHAPQSGVYLEQLTCILQGELDSALFQRAWQQVVARHSVLRTRFVWEGLSEPYQIVDRSVDLSVTYLDWRALSATEQQQQWSLFLHQDRAQNFDLSTPPLMRITLIGLADHAVRLICSYHHILLDGWSIPLLVKDLLTAYAALRQGQVVGWPSAPRYRDYIRWLQRQDLSAAEIFWRRMLQGVYEPTVLGTNRVWTNPVETTDLQAEQIIELSATATLALQAFARQHQLTLNTCVQGAWALLLRRYSGQDDVVFGTIVSGRPADLPGVEAMVGLFINTLPVRVSLATQEPVVAWLQQLQAQQSEMRQYEYSPLADVQRWSRVPPGTPLLESILVFENYPLDTSLQAQLQPLNIQVADWRYLEQINYPLLITVHPGERLSVKATFDRRRFDEVTIDQLLRHWQTLLQNMLADPRQNVAYIQMISTREAYSESEAFNDELE